MKAPSGKHQPAKPQTYTNGRPPAKARRAAKAAPPPPKWRTDDTQELAARRLRAREERWRIVPRAAGQRPFTDFEVRRVADEPDQPGYLVEIRATGLAAEGNWCSCPDFIKSGLGTCKHVEAVLLSPGMRPASASEGSPFVELYWPAGAESPRVWLPRRLTPATRDWLTPYLAAHGHLRQPWGETLAVLRRALVDEPAAASGLRISRGVLAEHERWRQRQELDRLRLEWLSRFDAASYLRHPLYPYQVEGLCHLAFTGRAMLTDEMGLGKTVQAIGAACLLRDLQNLQRVLVVCPVSLKAEWEEQIHKFTGQQAHLIMGLRPQRVAQYRQPRGLFVVCNYEQVRQDVGLLNEHLRPDLVILDEAQRIKNWRTTTARQVKSLVSPFAFVLTGTPLENRIDELYSLTEFLDPRVFGSLFRFNREFYRFDDKGRPCGLQNLEQLNQRLQPIMLRRRKDQIAEQLPDRVDNNYFVELTPTQRERYFEYEEIVAKLAQIANRRPLTPEEQDRLQQSLACMRMLCDTCYILDDSITDAPKLDELERVLADLWAADPARKIIVFSEWERMLELLRERLTKAGIAFAWHTGSVPQLKRRDEINRFKQAAECRLFLSTDAGAVGLNLQAASVVVNLDLPWNPAKLEQRIARAWRKHQTRSVQVINFISQDSIEHRMLGTLDYKRALADFVLDARGDVATIEGANAKARFMEQLQKVLGQKAKDSAAALPAAPAPRASSPTPTPALAPPPPPPPTPKERLRAACAVHLPGQAMSALVTSDASGQPTQLLVIGGQAANLRPALASGPAAPELTVLSRQEFELLQALANKGFIQFTPAVEKVWENPSWATPTPSEAQRRLSLVEGPMAGIERQVRLAEILLDGGFVEEGHERATRVAGTLACLAWFLEEPLGNPALPSALTAEQYGHLAREPRLAPLLPAALAQAAPATLPAALRQIHAQLAETCTRLRLSCK